MKMHPRSPITASTVPAPRKSPGAVKAARPNSALGSRNSTPPAAEPELVDLNVKIPRRVAETLEHVVRVQGTETGTYVASALACSLWTDAENASLDLAAMGTAMGKLSSVSIELDGNLNRAS